MIGILKIRIMLHITKPFKMNYGPWIVHGSCLPDVNFTEVSKEMTDAGIASSKMYTSVSSRLQKSTKGDVEDKDAEG